MFFDWWADTLQPIHAYSLAVDVSCLYGWPIMQLIYIVLIYKEIQRDRVQSHIWLTASSYIVENLRISSYIGKRFLIYDFAPNPIWIFLIYEENLVFFFYQCIVVDIFTSLANSMLLWLIWNIAAIYLLSLVTLCSLLVCKEMMYCECIHTVYLLAFDTQCL